MPLSSDPERRKRQLQNLRPTPPPPGNTRALRHGGRARAATLLRAGSWSERLFAELEREAPLRAGDGSLPVHDRQAVELLASCLARLESVSGWLDVRPPVDERGRPWAAEETAARLRREAARLLDQLGMTPTARARLGVDLMHAGAGMAAAMQLDAEQERREREGGADA